MGDQTDKQAEKISNCCGWLFAVVIGILAIAVCVGIVAFAVWLNT